ncbi:hypothetical protein SAMD00019534_087960 [Acytostelium subglobosum LB1]|uniref:hypothetical protein n=1 Tax=Acytostelium subglobosum LB1 TaxID=1410327 RepID=UPI000644B133|nr:hypothetical protein SAMD00019534_087960 [Acytostelium subglobosum LB1]GAM25621.1 hypothetical protein SAMD00019534_087960 [Acytostelium subglobosum LB1]|eukprot:XP_012751607.1 hypothetical protein SAMD00019534_087960 [Acytostelium subglobosum LB1]
MCLLTYTKKGGVSNSTKAARDDNVLWPHPDFDLGKKNKRKTTKDAEDEEEDEDDDRTATTTTTTGPDGIVDVDRVPWSWSKLDAPSKGDTTQEDTHPNNRSQQKETVIGVTQQKNSNDTSITAAKRELEERSWALDIISAADWTKVPTSDLLQFANVLHKERQQQQLSAPLEPAWRAKPNAIAAMNELPIAPPGLDTQARAPSNTNTPKSKNNITTTRTT